MTLYEKLIAENYRHCDICNKETLNPSHGWGYQYDRLVCANSDCQAEITFSTTTIMEDKSIEKKLETLRNFM